MDLTRVRLGSLLHEPDSVESPGEQAGDLLLPGGLDDSSLLDVCHSMLWSSCGLLFDIRPADLEAMGNTILVVVRGVVRTSLRCRPGSHLPYNWTAWNSKVKARRRGVTVDLDLDPEGALTVAGAVVFVFDLDVPGLPESPADYATDSERAVADGQPNWMSEARVCGTAFLGPSANA